MTAPKASNRRSRTILWQATEAAAIVMYVAFALAYALTIPHGGGPDERGHAMYVRALADGQLPLPSLEVEAPERPDQPYATPQAHHPPTFYALVAAIYIALGRSAEALYLSGRLLSIAMGVGTLLVTRAAALRAFPQRREAVAGGLVIAAGAATSQLVAAGLNNETASSLVVALALWVCARALEDDRASPVAVGVRLGAVLGLGLLVKLTAAAAIMPLIAGTVAVARRAGGDTRRRAFAGIVAGIVIAGAIAAPWMAHNMQVSGHIFYNVTQRSVYQRPIDVLLMPEVTIPLLLVTFEEMAHGVFWPNWYARSVASRLWGIFMGVNRQLHFAPVWLDGLIVAAIGVAGWGLARAREELSGAGRAIVAAMLGIIAMGLAGVLWQTLLVDSHIVRWGPRYALMFVPSLGMLLALGWGALLPDRGREALPLALLAALVALDLFAVLHVARFVG